MKKILTKGVYKAMRTTVFTDESIHYYDNDLLVKMFLDELSERQWKKRMTVTNGWDYLWYITYDGRLGMVKKGGCKCNAEKLIKKHLIEPDALGVMRAKQVLDGCGCQIPQHRPIIEALSRGRWSQYVVDTLSNYLDGGKAIEMVIDRDFATAYAPFYNTNTHIEDLVCSYSCMSGRPDEAQDFYGNIEGCYVARFLKDGDDIGRCIMYEYNGIRHFIRIYCRPEYQRDCIYTLRKNMKEGDLFGRDKCIEGLHLFAKFDEDTPNMYLDGDHYGFSVEDGKLYVTDYDYDWNADSTSGGTFADAADDEGIHVCHYCGKWISGNSDYTSIDGTCYCDDDCAESDGCYKCEECGEWMREPEITTVDGCYYCSRRCALDSDNVCTENGDWVYYDEAFSPDEGDHYYKDEQEAIEDGWNLCADCGEWCKTRYACSDGLYRCENCLSDNGWKLTYVKEQKDDKETETSND